MKELKLNNKNYKLNLHIGSRQFYFFYKLVNNLIVNGKKDTALNIINTLITLIKEKYIDKDPLFILDKILLGISLFNRITVSFFIYRIE